MSTTGPTQQFAPQKVEPEKVEPQGQQAYRSNLAPQAFGLQKVEREQVTRSPSFGLSTPTARLGLPSTRTDVGSPGGITSGKPYRSPGGRTGATQPRLAERPPDKSLGYVSPFPGTVQGLVPDGGSYSRVSEAFGDWGGGIDPEPDMDEDHEYSEFDATRATESRQAPHYGRP